MFLAISIAAISGLLVGAVGCYIWRESHLRQQLREVLAVMETSEYREDISLPILSQLRRRATIGKQQQQQLQQQLFSWQSLLQEAPIGYLQVDADNQVMWCNQTAQHLLLIQKWHPGQARLLLELVRSYELDRVITKTRSHQMPQELIWQFYSGYQDVTNSSSIWLKVNSTSLEDGAVGIFIQNHQDRVDAATAQERWLGDLAHEIRTPLTSIHLLAETLQTKVTPELTRWADRILKETNRLISLVQHFSDLSQLETASAQSIQLVEVDLIRSIDDVWHTVEPIARQRNIEFILTGPSYLVVEIDIARFTQVLINLFDNSLKYCPERGHIWIDIHLSSTTASIESTRVAKTNWVEIDFYDDGAGFTPSELPYIFDRLYRGDASRQRQPTSAPMSTLDFPQTTGNGLGLAIVRQIILAHQGTIRASNHPTTGGALFKIVLPID
jgi:two-component system, OmpR family, phosphate regulon sensor histidine kinase PhoR